MKVNSHGVNEKIKANILSEEQMKEIGFTNYYEPSWYFCKPIQLNKKEYRGLDISFSVSIPKDGSDIRIDILDEAFCQPYDYQHILSENKDHKLANMVREQVEYWMEYLEKEGILEGHIKGEYI